VRREQKGCPIIRTLKRAKAEGKGQAQKRQKRKKPFALGATRTKYKLSEKTAYWRKAEKDKENTIQFNRFKVPREELRAETQGKGNQGKKILDKNATPNWNGKGKKRKKRS